MGIYRIKNTGFYDDIHLGIGYIYQTNVPNRIIQVNTKGLSCNMDQNDGNVAVIERRGKPRIKCAYPAMVRGCSIDGKKFEENATVLNMSASGVYLLVNRFIEKGQELSVKIAFPSGSLKWGSSKLVTTGVVGRTDFLEGTMGVAIKFHHYRFC